MRCCLWVYAILQDLTPNSLYFGDPQGALASAIGKAGAAAVAGFVSGAIQTGTVQGAFQGAASAMLFYGAGALGGPGGFNLPTTGFSMGRVLLHAAAGCINAVLSGGNCGKGAVTAGLTKALGSALPDATGAGADAINTVKYAVIGGTMAELGGGKFANGALTGAFQYMMNQAQSNALTPIGDPQITGMQRVAMGFEALGKAASEVYFKYILPAALIEIAPGIFANNIERMTLTELVAVGTNTTARSAGPEMLNIKMPAGRSAYDDYLRLAANYSGDVASQITKAGYEIKRFTLDSVNVIYREVSSTPGVKATIEVINDIKATIKIKYPD